MHTLLILSWTLYKPLVAFRYPPLGVSEEISCDDETELFFYNVSSAACESFAGGMCTRSRNKFMTLRSCEQSCVVDSQGLERDDNQ